MKVTILTPSYNRCSTLVKLYESLIIQSNKNFEWLIIDDGSTDNTKELINKYIEEKKINIKYFYQKNGGKHRALNKGISMIKNELTFIVDSDDSLTKDAVEIIIKYFKKYETNKKICALSFLRCFPDMRINGDSFKENEYVSNYIDCRINEKVKGDKAEVYRTEYLKKYPFIEIKGEKFLFEDFVWIKMAEKYDTVHINIPIYIGEYLTDGLTNNISTMKFNSPIGMMERSLIMCSSKCNFIYRYKAMMMYIAYSDIANIEFKTVVKKCPYKNFLISAFVPGKIFSLYLKNKQKRRKK